MTEDERSEVLWQPEARDWDDEKPWPEPQRDPDKERSHPGARSGESDE